MKKIIPFLSIFLTTLCFSEIVASNDSKLDEFRSIFWTDPNPIFEIKEVPEKWKDKSAVILAKEIHQEYKKFAMSSELSYKNHFHERIKLQDKASVEKYAQFTFYGDYGNVKKYAGFKVIKPNGKEIVLTHKDAKIEEAELNKRELKTLKLAIPNLEIGDILDYYMVHEEIINMVYVNHHSFEPVLWQLNDEYPIVKQYLSFDVMRKCYINFNAVNGAPSLQLDESKDKDKSHYYLKSENLESTEDIRWLYKNLALPSIKFKVTFAGNKSFPGFLGKAGVLKTSVTKQEIEDFLEYTMGPANATHLKDVKKHIKTYHKNETDLNVIAREIFFKERYLMGVKNLPDQIIKGNSSFQEFDRFRFVRNISGIYKHFKIPFDVYVFIPRHIAKLENLILENEIYFAIKVVTSKPFFIGNFSNCALPNEVDGDYQNVEAYKYYGNNTINGINLLKTRMPVDEFEENYDFSSITVSLDELDLSKANIECQKRIKGNFKSFYQYNMTDYFDYLNDDAIYNSINDKTSSYAPKAYRIKRDKMLSDKKSERDKNRSDFLMQYYKKRFSLNVTDINDFKVIRTGRHVKYPDLEFEFDFNTDELSRKVGPNIMIDIGKLIEMQVNLSQEEREREYDVYMPFARGYETEIKVAIPDGYEVQGLEQLNAAMENATGGFMSEASLANNELVVRVSKYYLHQFEKKEDWPRMIEFLDLASEFNNKKILLKKL